MDDSALNIRYFRTYRADYLHFNAILPQKNDKSLPPEIEAWAKQVKVELDKVIKREVSTGVIPKLPVTSSQ